MPITTNGIGVETRRGRFYCDTPYALKDILKTLPGHRWHKQEKMWSWPATPRTVKALDFRFSTHSKDYGADETFRYLLNYVKAGNYCTNWLEEGLELPPIPKSRYNLKHWHCQRQSFWHAVERFGGLSKHARGGATLELDMGCGKTRVTYDLISNFRWWRTLVVCPAKVIPAWEKNYRRWASIQMKVVNLPTKWRMQKRADAIRQCTEFQNTPVVVVLNYECLDHAVIRDCLKEIRWNTIVLDEGHRVKDPGGKRSKFLGGDHRSDGLGDLAECRLELTGTFLPNGPLDAYGQARFIDASHWGYSFARYRAQYAILAPAGRDGPMVAVKGYQNEEDLGRHLSEFSIQVDAEDTEQDLPGEHHIDIPVHLDEAEAKAYKAMEDDFVVFLSDDEEVTAANVLVKIGKLQEITGGFLRNPETKSLTAVGDSKAQAMKEKMEDLPPNEQIVVACRLRPDLDKLEAIAKELGREYYEVSGRRNDLAAWQEANDNGILGSQIAAAKEGVDLGMSRWCFFYSLGYQPGEFRQFKKRQNRPGETGEKRWDRINYFHLVAQETVDEDIYDAITTKGNVIDFVKRVAKRGRGEL